MLKECKLIYMTSFELKTTVRLATEYNTLAKLNFIRLNWIEFMQQAEFYMIPSIENDHKIYRDSLPDWHFCHKGTLAIYTWRSNNSQSLAYHLKMRP